MRRGGLFFIGLISAIVTIISLNIAFGRPGYYHERYYNGRLHHCNSRYDERYHNNEKENEQQQKTDSLNRNY